MRLIDADELLKFFTVDTANQTYRFGTVKKQIENAPTVPAIPLERIKQLREEINSKICPAYTGYNEYEMAVSDGHQTDLDLIDDMIKEYSDGE